jgi:hypothetical protein
MLMILLGVGMVYIFLHLAFEIFADKSLRPWAVLSLGALLLWAGFESSGLQGIISFIPICLLLLLLIYIDFKEK